MTLNRIMKWLLFAAVIAGLLVCAFFVFRFNQPKPTTNIHYADTQNKQQTLDMYMPKSKDEDKKKKHPVMIYLHGGGFGQAAIRIESLQRLIILQVKDMCLFR